MSAIEAVLVYRPSGFGAEAEIRLARSSEPAVLRRVAEAALAELRNLATDYRGIDEGLAAMRDAEVSRLETVIKMLIPLDPRTRPDRSKLKLVPPPTTKDGM